MKETQNMQKESIQRVAITGAAGQIAYSLLFRLANGEIWGQDTKVALHLLEVPSSVKALEGVIMELEDCGFPTLVEIKAGSDPEEIFADVNLALLVGAKPRIEGMERKDLLEKNGGIFTTQGKALDRVASKDAKVLVIGNPCNTNCLIAMHQASRLSPSHFYAMTMLDQKRAAFQLAKRANAPIHAIDRMIIWGNHSSTQVPDFTNATIHGKKVTETILDRNWLETTFFQTIQKRGSAIIQARGKSSAASAANAIVETLKCLYQKQRKEEIFSLACLSDPNPYQIQKGLIFSFPCRQTKAGEVEIVPGFSWNSFLQQQIWNTQQELLEEKSAVQTLLVS